MDYLANLLYVYLMGCAFLTLCFGAEGLMAVAYCETGSIGGAVVSITIKYFVEWRGEMAAGIRPGSEDVSITFEHTESVDAETIEFWRESLKEYFDGAAVYTEQEAKELQQSYPCSECGQPYNHRNHWAPFGWHNYC